MTLASTLVYDNVWARLKGGAEDEAWSLLRYRAKGYMFTPAYKKGHWDGWTHLITSSGLFPSGLVPWLLRELRRRGYEVEVSDQRQPRLGRIPLVSHDLDLMPHQIEAVIVATKEERGIIEHPVAAGKSRTAMGLVEAVGMPTLVLVHRKDLLAQFVGGTRTHGEGFRDFFTGQSIGLIGNGLWLPGDITVATFQSIWSKLTNEPATATAFLAGIGCVVVDEAHHIPAKTFEAVMKLTPYARYRYGFSATPFKSDDDEARFRVVAWTGDVIHKVTPAEGVTTGRLVPANIYFIAPTWPAPPEVTETRLNDKGKRVPAHSWQEEYQVGIVENEGRNGAILQLATRLRQAGPTLILVERLDHGRLLAEQLGCPFIQGETELSQRGSTWKLIREGSLDCLVASRIADEGVDIPGIRALILAGGGKAQHVCIQRIGRGMRASEGKERVYVFDFEDLGLRLAKHTKQRVELYREQPAYTLTETTVEEVLS